MSKNDSRGRGGKNGKTRNKRDGGRGKTTKVSGG